MEISWLEKDTHSHFGNIYLKIKTVSELDVALEKILDNFPQVQLTKLYRVVEIVWQSTWMVMEDILNIFLYSVLLTLSVFELSWIVETIFDNVTTARLPWLKAV